MIINDHEMMNDKMMLDKDRYSISINSIIIDRAQGVHSAEHNPKG